MNFKIASLLLVASANFPTHTLAKRGGGGGGKGGGGNGDYGIGSNREGGTGGRNDGQGHHGSSEFGGLFGDDGHGSKHGPFQSLDQFDITFSNITCDPSIDCSLRNDEVGTFICRGLYHPMTGDQDFETKCIPTDKALDTDVCGCCDGECPEQPAFIDITCDDQDPDQDQGERRRLGRGGGRGGGRGDDKVTVCRDVTDPVTGETAPATIRTPSSKGLADDVCGCCDGVCPDDLDGRPFDRPDSVNITCLADNLVTCQVPRRGGKGKGKGNGHGPGGMMRSSEEDDFDLDMDLDEEGDSNEDIEGVFVCRTTYDPITGASESEPRCIPSDRAWESDVCGCCGDECPEQPEKVELECEVDESGADNSCPLRRGKEGVYVCRSAFHPVSGDVVELSLCVSDEMGWENDVCGCCASGCPEAPLEGGNGSTQTITSALGVEESSGGYHLSFIRFASSVAIVSILALF